MPRPLALAVLTVALSTPAFAQDTPTEPAITPGEYRDRSSFEMFHGLLLKEDGTFEWALSAGAMDRRSQGTWEVRDGVGRLTTLPKPVAPVFERQPNDTAEDAPFLFVSWPNGEGIAGINFSLMCEDGKQIIHYTQSDGWDLVPGECEQPTSIRLEESIQDIGPTYFSLLDPPPESEDGAGNPIALRFFLVPNDFGIQDLTDTYLWPTPEGLRMDLLGSSAEMIRMPDREDQSTNE